MKCARSVPQVNMHRLTESDFSFDDVTFSMEAMPSFHAENCCHLV